MRTSTRLTTLNRAIALLTACVLALIGSALVVIPNASADYHDTASQGWRIDGDFVYDITRIDDRIYVGGVFDGVIAPDGTTTSQANLAAFDAMTGDYIPSFTATTNGPVQTIEPSADGSVLYVGGEFTQVNGASYIKAAAVSATDGSTVAGFRADITSGKKVFDIEVQGNDVYLGGDYSHVNGTKMPRLTRVDAMTGDLDPSFQIKPNKQILDMALAPSGDRLYIGGVFETVNGVDTNSLAAIDLIADAVDTTFTRPYHNQVRAVEATDDRVVANDYKTNFIRITDTDGNEVRVLRGDGDFQDSEIVGSRVIIGSHSREVDGHDVPRLHAINLADGTVSTTFRVPVAPWPGVFAIYGSGSDLWIGGQFNKAGSATRQRLARIPMDPAQSGPSTPAGFSAFGTSDGVDLSWGPSTDDTGIQAYRVLRGGNQVAFVSGTSWTDTGVAAGDVYTYAVEAVDLDHNVSTRSAQHTATAGGTPPAPGGHAPDATVTAPVRKGTITGSTITIHGEATDDADVAEVLVAIRNLNDGPEFRHWLQLDEASWDATYRKIAATLDSGGTGAATSWSIDLSLAPGTYAVQVTAIDGDGNKDEERPFFRFNVVD